MRNAFVIIGDRLVTVTPQTTADLGRIADCTRIAEQFYRAAECQQHTRPAFVAVSGEEVVISGASPMGSTMMVCAPTCSTAVVAKHVAACLAAGNTVELALFEPPCALLMVLLMILEDVLPASRFRVASERTGWQITGTNPTVIVLTETDAFLNDEPRVRFRDPASSSTTNGLVDFYTRSSTVRVPAGRDSR
ncbi:hypothetical protein [Subtercola boreus]|uniref:Aldehyde dehydrogenase domain-containing protein n=1 Tax=Subtercola boreus TaxID=120213 RepID=A0A3E0WDL6_9MICO|nr:hypothetical protein [Subtercola boreus]RFA23245.1 hypothetical protein B7R24_02100 [Subtercola boreus]RFA23318.1 hypothetical protein B7R23_02090 [Subtercola boreus]RFA29121.1 hypothetical protein B7R25_02105 [Subtercola boreus]